MEKNNGTIPVTLELILIAVIPTIIAVAVAAKLGIGLISILIALICLAVQVLACVMMGGRVTKTCDNIIAMCSGDMHIEPIEVGGSDELAAASVKYADFHEHLAKLVVNLDNLTDYMEKHGVDMGGLVEKTLSTTNEINSMLAEIAKGATTQAEQLEHANVQVADMGDNISQIVGNVHALDSTADGMKKSGDVSHNIILELSKSNEKSREAFHDIQEQIRATDRSVKEIGEAVKSITEIASETNILSINASIEAARAGEAGKGFAVVASEVQKLASESAESAEAITEIVDKLSKESARNIKMMSEVEVTVEEQDIKLRETMNRFDEVNDGINASRTGIAAVRTKADVCDTERERIIGVIGSLAAISQENAASTEETSSAMQALNESVKPLSKTGATFLNISKSLGKDLEMFSITK